MQNITVLPSGSEIVVKTRRAVHALDRRHVSKTGGFFEVTGADNVKARRVYEAIAASAHAEFFRRNGATVARAACRVKKDGSGSFTMRATIERARFGKLSAFALLESARKLAFMEWKAAKLAVEPIVLPKAA